MERAVVFAESDRIGLADLPGLDAAPATPEGPADASLAEVEKAHILRVLEAVGGHRGRAARRLGISEATLFRRLRRYREEDP
jgi:transcriptional regulator of acetoin/glycerol metabolism